MVDFNESKIDIYTGVNDLPVAPTATKGGNGSHLVSVCNSLIDATRTEFLNVDASINRIQNILDESTNNYNDISNRIDELQFLTLAAFPVNLTHWHDSSVPVTGGQLQNYNFIDQPYGTVSQQQPSNLLDEFKFSYPLDRGLYQMHIIARTSEDGGVFALEVTTNSTPIDTVDLYSSTPAPIVIVIPFKINFVGMQTFSIKAVGTTQTGYALPITKFSVVPVEPT